MLRTIATVGTFLTIATTSAQAANLTATAATFQAVMSKVAGGDTVALTGSFGLTTLTNKNFSSLVTIDASAASFTDTLMLNGVSNVRIQGGNYGSTTNVISYNTAINILGGSNVSISNANVVGAYTGEGIVFKGTSNAAVTGTTLSQLHAGVVFANVVNGSISNNRSIGAVADGFDITNGRNIDVGYNTCSGSTPTTGAHPDCVQMFSTPGAAPLYSINVHNNMASGETQGFDNFGAVAGSNFISIVNNRIDGLMPQGIDCTDCVNSTITGNIATSLTGAWHKVQLNVLGGTNNIVSNNFDGDWNRAAALDLVFATRAQLMGNVTLDPVAAAAVPEPAAWAMLVAGFGLVGLGQRARRQYRTA